MGGMQWVQLCAHLVGVCKRRVHRVHKPLAVDGTCAHEHVVLAAEGKEQNQQKAAMFPGLPGSSVQHCRSHAGRESLTQRRRHALCLDQPRCDLWCVREGGREHDEAESR